MNVAHLLHATAGRLRVVGPATREPPFVAQRTAGDCGAACLTMVLALHGRHLDRAEMHALLPDGAASQSALALLQAAEAQGLAGRGVALAADSVPALRAGSILHVDGNHFVVFARCAGERVVVLDPGRGRTTMGMAELQARFSGIAIELWPGAGFVRRAPTRARLGRYLAPVLHHRSALGGALLLSAVLVVLSLSIPIASRVIIDDLLPAQPPSWLPIFVGATAGIACMQALVSITRSLSLNRLRELVDRKLMGDVVGRLMALPFPFFQRRTVGDLVMRLGSVGHIREVLTGSTLSAGVDGCLVSLYLAILLWFSPMMAATAAVLAVLQLGLFAASRSRLRDDAAHYLATEAELRGYQTRMLMGIETLKAGGMVSEATARLDRVFERVLASARTRGRHIAWIEGVAAGLRVLSPLALLGVGTYAVLDGGLSLGTMVAAGQLAAAFLVPAVSLVQTAGSIEVLRGHVERLDEIWTQPSEATGAHVPTDIGRIEIRDLTFTHGPSQPPCLVGLHLDIAPRQHIAIVGPSGSGKSTLARVLLGLLPPQAGTITYGGVPLAECSLEHLRRLTGIVTQEASLFDMTIADNIRLGRPDASFEALVRAAELAGIHDEILAMPMGYDTLLTDGGSSLSGGQRQRITLAR
ncbi:MAG TPA: peptidase domain-containing ABC transporter, partial [Nannocystaceae bacterium]|nr:peptidase domain-containing ABC transporter [Nannocystaceae bacterium]